ncbi:LytTR family transcriptional regulator DNA-binding domain-containing protein [Pseudoalteromonas luteoviolacea]|uniref:LytTR family transcriptional regulator DNA-binding domain-containing protein n=1 Tax=Pseudoalteromonas luteoviolacea TaxID=43657 RepID=UPI001EEE7B38|nr:LytTR family transcriptional regulator DNA-binding domain-containing protein [Pseudoalteromonas luteoviolacea]MCF6437874.1 LytTR family transcriptional regulator DNA-binding domain-containing protein [Pseudoalteromonas luteoviolacea]
MWITKIIKQHTTWCGYAAIVLYVLMNNTINAFSNWTEHNRSGTATIQLWEPFVWHYSSALSLFLLLPALFIFFKRLPPRANGLLKQLIAHISISFLFSLCHVLLMVLCRHGVYILLGRDYDFGNYFNEFIYEYRKDVLTYISIFVCYHCAKWIISTQLNALEQREVTAPITQFVVKKQGSEYQVKVADIQWYEACGNYVNLHSRGRVYPLRHTLNRLCAELEHSHVTRVHRSFAINDQAIKSVRYTSSGDGVITLISGDEINLSRRYKEDFRKIYKASL